MGDNSILALVDNKHAAVSATAYLFATSFSCQQRKEVEQTTENSIVSL